MENWEARSVHWRRKFLTAHQFVAAQQRQNQNALRCCPPPYSEARKLSERPELWTALAPDFAMRTSPPVHPACRRIPRAKQSATTPSASHCACVLHCDDGKDTAVHHPPAHNVVESASAQIRITDGT